MVTFILIALGIFSVSYFPSLPGVWVTSLIILVLLICCCLQRWRMSLLTCGILYGIAYGYYIICAQLPQLLDGEHFFVEGEVIGLPQTTMKAERFHLRIRKLSSRKSSINLDITRQMQGKVIALNWYKNYRMAENQF